MIIYCKNGKSIEVREDLKSSGSLDLPPFFTGINIGDIYKVANLFIGHATDEVWSAESGEIESFVSSIRHINGGSDTTFEMSCTNHNWRKETWVNYKIHIVDGEYVCIELKPILLLLCIKHFEEEHSNIELAQILKNDSELYNHSTTFILKNDSELYNHSTTFGDFYEPASDFKKVLVLPERNNRFFLGKETLSITKENGDVFIAEAISHYLPYGKLGYKLSKKGSDKNGPCIGIYLSKSFDSRNTDSNAKDSLTYDIRLGYRNDKYREERILLYNIFGRSDSLSEVYGILDFASNIYNAINTIRTYVSFVSNLLCMDAEIEASPTSINTDGGEVYGYTFYIKHLNGLIHFVVSTTLSPNEYKILSFCDFNSFDTYIIKPESTGETIENDLKILVKKFLLR